MRLSQKDNELITHAALAAGYEMGAAEGRPEHEIHTWTKDFEEYLGFWNPLLNCAEALRLIVDLNMNLTVSDGSTTVTSLGGEVTEVHGYDEYGATRLAIVRAAAAHFKAKESSTL